MTIEEARSKGVFRTVVNLWEAWQTTEQPTDQERDLRDFYGESWVELREPTQAEAVRLGDPLKDPKAADEVIPGCIVGHNFHHADEREASAREVWDLIRGSATLYSHVVQTWLRSIPLVRRSASGSAGSPPSTSMADAGPTSR